MTNVSKVLAVLIVTMSLAFLGFVSAMLVGGPNWIAQRSDELLAREGYGFESSGDEVVTWSVSRDGTSIASDPVEAAVIVAARKDLENRQKVEIQDLTQQTTQLEDRLTRLRELIEVDQRAMENRAATLQYLLDQQAEKNRILAEETNQLNEQGLQAQATLKARRQDAERLQQQIEELVAETSRINEHAELLQGRLVILLGDIARLKARRNQLRGQLGQAVGG